jgi:hypothetical protein
MNQKTKYRLIGGVLILIVAGGIYVYLNRELVLDYIAFSLFGAHLPHQAIPIDNGPLPLR